jgi:carbon monoxide dehydrogenase subunit G
VRMSGTAIMHAPPDRVWAALTDPAVLAAAIPGCERLEPAGPDHYQFTIAAGIGLLQGTYTGGVALSDQHEPHSFRLSADGAGGPGTVGLSVRFGLTAGQDGSTELAYDADGEVGGLLAGVGQRMVTAIAQRMLGEFFRSLDAQLQEGNEAAAATSAPALAAGLVPAPRLPASMPGVAPDQAGAAKAPFLAGAIAGTAATLAGVAISSVLRRRRS